MLKYTTSSPEYTSAHQINKAKMYFMSRTQYRLLQSYMDVLVKSILIDSQLNGIAFEGECSVMCIGPSSYALHTSLTFSTPDHHRYALWS